MQLNTWRLWISYLGTQYAGYQHQPGLETIESKLSDAFEQLLGERPRLTPAGRTDAGVHARGQVVSCQFYSRFDERTLPAALSHFVGPNIKVYRADRMHVGFDAKRQSIGKRYVYRISQQAKLNPFNRLFAWDIRQPLNLEAMQEAANYLVGDHDYESFRSVHCTAEHARRYLWLIRITPEVHIDIRGNAFCHNMVRIMVGTLVEVGMGKRDAQDLCRIRDSRDRQLAGPTAPAHGLSLEEVYYPDTLSHAELPLDATFPRFPVTPETWPC
ncbi:MAG: tRNA pseudouridine(38-40) synthase TruA [Myxococcaceae bacterium]|nr:tRNA pseudouridine(38-40) synthase TruA [Myxococcaceae bacterium]MBH2006114.1 tRNA pseudouridine(38-40) synthase TruA [Myxococcaceae bacterium]